MMHTWAILLAFQGVWAQDGCLNGECASHGADSMIQSQSAFAPLGKLPDTPVEEELEVDELDAPKPCVAIKNKLKTIKAKLQQDDAKLLQLGNFDKMVSVTQLGDDAAPESGLDMMASDADLDSLTDASVKDPKVLSGAENILKKGGLDAGASTDTMMTLDDIKQMVQCTTGTSPTLELNQFYHQGDMLLDQPSAALLQVRGTGNASQRHAGTPWNTNGVSGRMPYCFASGVSAQTKANFKAALKTYTDHVSCVSFEEVAAVPSSTDKYCDCCTEKCAEIPSTIVTECSGGCNAYVGMITWGMTNSQRLNLEPNGCNSVGVIAHEVGHALGMGHEHSRADRDQYITVHRATTALKHGEGWASQLDVGTAIDTTVPYDPLSLMHYSSGAPGGKWKWIETKAPNQMLTPFLGNRLGVTEMDVKQMAALYSCSASQIVNAGVSSAVLLDRVRYKGCYGEDGAKVSPADARSKSSCDYYKASGYCDASHQYYSMVAGDYCKKTCGACDAAPNPAGGGAASMYPAYFKTGGNGGSDSSDGNGGGKGAGLAPEPAPPRPTEAPTPKATAEPTPKPTAKATQAPGACGDAAAAALPSNWRYFMRASSGARSKADCATVVGAWGRTQCQRALMSAYCPETCNTCGCKEQNPTRFGIPCAALASGSYGDLCGGGSSTALSVQQMCPKACGKTANLPCGQR